MTGVASLLTYLSCFWLALTVRSVYCAARRSSGAAAQWDLGPLNAGVGLAANDLGRGAEAFPCQSAGMMPLALAFVMLQISLALSLSFSPSRSVADAGAAAWPSIRNAVQPTWWCALLLLLQGLLQVTAPVVLAFGLLVLVCLLLPASCLLHALSARFVCACCMPAVSCAWWFDPGCAVLDPDAAAARRPLVTCLAVSWSSRRRDYGDESHFGTVADLIIGALNIHDVIGSNGHGKISWCIDIAHRHRRRPGGDMTHWFWASKTKLAQQRALCPGTTLHQEPAQRRDY
jgi:hypothetical protein